MKIIEVNHDNLESEHICCAISDKKCAAGVTAKKNLISSLMDDGYHFRKLDVRGKVFIDYMPAEASWLPIDAANYMLLGCFWVSGQYKAKGWGKKLLSECLSDSEPYNGIIAVSSEKKRPFMSDPKFLKMQGFEVVDEAEPYFKLWCRKTKSNAADPVFLDHARSGRCEDNRGLTVYYSDFCPFNGYWNEVELKKYAESKNIPLKLIKINSREEGRRLPVPWILNSVFYRGKFLTQEIKIDRILEKEL